MATRKRASRKLSLELPGGLYERLEHLARARRTTAAEAAAALLRRSLGGDEFAAGMGERQLAEWRDAFAPLTEDEMLLVDGILMGDATQQ
jgi:hypothetical protein